MPMIQSKQQIQPSTPPKDPLIAALLSFLLLGGVGQIYLGQTTKGIVILVAALLLSCVGIGVVVWIIGIIDAYQIATMLKNGQAVGDWQFFWEK